MPYFKDADEVYDLIGGLFQDLLEDPELSAPYRKANLVVRWSYRNPESEITTKMTEDGEVVLGESSLEPDVTLSMEADLAHRYWLGKVSPTTAMAKGQLKAKGNFAKVMKLVPLAKPAFPRYRARLEERGRQDLLEA